MAFAEIKIYSAALGMQTAVNVIIPQKSTDGEIGTNSTEKIGAPKCMYLLHGLSDDNTIWCRRTSIERYAQKYGICVIMPNGEKSFYTDMKYGLKYYTYIAKELPMIIRDLLRVSDKREDNIVAGLSMGGYGALKIGMKECENFGAIISLSAVSDIAENKNLFPNEMKCIFGDDMSIPNEDNLFEIAKQCSGNPNKPKVFMGVGTEDFLYEGNIKLKKHLENLNFDLSYEESPGVHCWEFWDEYIQYGLKWYFEKNCN